MILPVNDRYRLTADTRCWALEELRVRRRQGKQVSEWTPIRWFNTLGGAVNGYAEFALRTSDARNLAEALAKVQRIAAELCEALRPVPRVVAMLVPGPNEATPASLCGSLNGLGNGGVA